MLVDKSDSHKYTAPVGSFATGVVSFGGRQQVTYIPVPVLIVFQYGKGVPPRSAISSKDRFTFRTYSQPKRAASGDELVSFGKNDPSARKDRAGGAALGWPDTRWRTEGLRCQYSGTPQND